MADGAVFAGCVHTLKDDEDGLGLRGEEDFLEGVELLAVFGGGELGGGLVAEAVVVAGGEF